MAALEGAIIGWPDDKVGNAKNRTLAISVRGG
jgi:hypothetical protein